MKTALIALSCCALLSIQARADDTIVIDSDTLTRLSGDKAAAFPQSDSLPSAEPSAGSAGTLAHPNETTMEEAEVIRERMPPEKMSVRQRRAFRRIAVAEQNKTDGATFESEYRNRPGVVVLPDGVMYRVLHSGTGPKPKAASLVECRYQGKLLDGTVFEQTGAERPMSFYVATFLPGLKEALLRMPVGSHWEIVVPPQLGYRELGDHLVGPNATLVYDMELIAVK